MKIIIFAFTLMVTIPALAQEKLENLELRWSCNGVLVSNSSRSRQKQPDQSLSFKLRFYNEANERVIITDIVALGGKCTLETYRYGLIFESGYVNTGIGSRPLSWQTYLQDYITVDTDCDRRTTTEPGQLFESLHLPNVDTRIPSKDLFNKNLKKMVIEASLIESRPQPQTYQTIQHSYNGKVTCKNLSFYKKH